MKLKETILARKIKGGLEYVTFLLNGRKEERITKATITPAKQSNSPAPAPNLLRALETSGRTIPMNKFINPVSSVIENAKPVVKPDNASRMAPYGVSQSQNRKLVSTNKAGNAEREMPLPRQKFQISYKAESFEQTMEPENKTVNAVSVQQKSASTNNSINKQLNTANMERFQHVEAIIWARKPSEDGEEYGYENKISNTIAQPAVLYNANDVKTLFEIETPHSLSGR